MEISRKIMQREFSNPIERELVEFKYFRRRAGHGER